MLIRVCYGHESHQLPLDLPGVSYTHGLCWPCFVRFCFEAIAMGYDRVEAYKAIGDRDVMWIGHLSGWRQCASQGYWPIYVRGNQEISHSMQREEEGVWVLRVEGEEVKSGSLDEVFEYAQEIG